MGGESRGDQIPITLWSGRVGINHPKFYSFKGNREKSRTIAQIPDLFSLKLRRIGISQLAPILGSKIRDLWDCPWLLLMLLGRFPQNLGQKLGQIQETSWISPIFNPDGRDLLGSTISKKLGIGELLKSRSQFWSGGSVPIVLVLDGALSSCF